MRIVIVTIVALLIAAPLCAAEARTLTLEQALAIAMEQNRDIARAREYARSVQGRYVEERSAALPQLGLSGSLGMSRDKSQEALMGSAPRQTTSALGITLSQPLYTWGKVGAAIRAAEVGLKTADEQLRLYRQAAARDVTTAFYDILLARELLNLAKENLEQKQRHLAEAQKRFTAGVATDYDVLAAEVAVENARPEQIRSVHAVETARDRLRFLLALDGEQVDAVGSLEPPTGAVSGYDEAYAVALKRRPDMADLRLRLGIYDELVTIANADDKPRLDLKGGAGWNWQEVQQGNGPDKSSGGAAWNVGLYMTFPFFDGMRTSGRVAQARSDLRTKQIEEKSLRDTIALEVRNSGNAYHEATEIVQALTGTVRQAERLVQMAEKGYEFGVKIRLEVEDAQLNLLQARGNLARARRDSQVARIGYQWAMGVAGE